jgi:hypothetical protein
MGTIPLAGLIQRKSDSTQRATSLLADLPEDWLTHNTKPSLEGDAADASRLGSGAEATACGGSAGRDGQRPKLGVAASDKFLRCLPLRRCASRVQTGTFRSDTGSLPFGRPSPR